MSPAKKIHKIDKKKFNEFAVIHLTRLCKLIFEGIPVMLKMLMLAIPAR